MVHIIFGCHFSIRALCYVRKRFIDALESDANRTSFFSSLINLQYGVIVRDSAITNVSFVGFILSTLFSAFYVFYTSKEGKALAWNKISIGAAVVAVTIAYAKFEDPANIEFRFGILLTVLMFGMVGAPLLDLGEIIRNKSVGQMPFAMTLMGGIVGALWLLYSIVLNNKIMIVSDSQGTL